MVKIIDGLELAIEAGTPVPPSAGALKLLPQADGWKSVDENGVVTPIGGGGGGITDITAGANITIDKTDPAVPVISSATLAALGGVPETRTVNGEPLSADVVLTTDEVAQGTTNLYNVQSDWNATTGVAQILNKPANVLTDITAGANITVDKTNPANPIISAASGGHVIQDEGVVLPQQPNLNFAGAGVAVTNDAANNATLVTIAGSTGGITDITAGANISIDKTNPANPVISSASLAALGGVPETRTVNGEPLSADVVLNTDDIAQGTTNLYNVQSDWTATTGAAQILNKPASFITDITAGTNITIDKTNPAVPVIAANVISATLKYWN